MRKYTFLLLIASLNTLCATAQLRYEGQVKNNNGEPVSAVTIVVEGNNQILLTDSAGFFRFDHAPGNFWIRFTNAEFENKQIQVAEDNMPAVIVLQSKTGLLDAAVVTAFENNRSGKNLAAAVSVIDKTVLNKFSLASLVPAVNTVAGVKMDERSPGSYRLSIRGNLLRSTFGVRNVKVYWDGIPFTDASGNTYFNELSPAIISRMEIIKGPSGSMYGSGTGGVVLLQSRQTDSIDSRSLQANISAGSYGLFSAGVSLQQNGKHPSQVSINHQQSDGYRSHTQMRRDVVHYNADFNLKKGPQLHANIFYADLFYQTPGGLTAKELAANPRQARPAAGIFRSAATQQAAIYLKTIYTGLAANWKLSNRWSNTTGIYGSYTDFKNPTIRNYEKKYDRGAGLRSVFRYDHSIFSAAIGGELQQGFFHSGVYGNKAGEMDTLQFNDDIDSRQMNIFAQASVNLPLDFKLSAGISYNRFNYDYLRTSLPNPVNEKTDFTPQYIPRISLLKKIKTTSVYVALSKGYSVPTIDEVHAGNDQFNIELKPEDAVNYEAGIKTDMMNGRLSAEVAYYLLQLKNTIVSRRDASGGDFYTNAGKTNQKGFEMSVNYWPIKKTNGFLRTLQFSGSYSNINAVFKNYQQGSASFDGNKLTGTPPNTVFTNISAATAVGLSADLGYSYTDRIPLNDANTVYASAYQLLFAKLGYRCTVKKTELYFFTTAQHSFNTPYSLGNDLNAAGNRFFNPSAPQTFTAGVACRFNLRSPASTQR